MYGIIKVAALDCLSEEELCEEFSAFDVPQIVIFTEKAKDDGERYLGKMAWNPIANAGTKKMQNFVSSVSSENFQLFTERDPTKNKILIFTDKKSTPALFKSLSKKYLDKLVFGEIRSSETELLTKFGVDSFPTLLALSDTDGLETSKFEGEMKVDQVQKFLSAFVYSAPKKVRKLEFQHLTEKKHKSGSLCGAKDSSICLLVFGEESEVNALQSLTELYENDPIHFAYIPSGEPGRQMQQTLFEGNTAVLYKPKRQKYLPIAVSSVEQMSMALSDALGGGGSWQQTNGISFGMHSEEL